MKRLVQALAMLAIGLVYGSLVVLYIFAEEGEVAAFFDQYPLARFSGAALASIVLVAIFVLSHSRGWRMVLIIVTAFVATGCTTVRYVPTDPQMIFSPHAEGEKDRTDSPCGIHPVIVKAIKGRPVTHFRIDSDVEILINDWLRCGRARVAYDTVTRIHFEWRFEEGSVPDTYGRPYRRGDSIGDIVANRVIAGIDGILNGVARGTTLNGVPLSGYSGYYSYGYYSRVTATLKLLEINDYGVKELLFNGRGAAEYYSGDGDLGRSKAKRRAALLALKNQH